jgi:hypothetical protein
MARSKQVTHSTFAAKDRAGNSRIVMTLPSAMALPAAQNAIDNAPETRAAMAIVSAMATTTTIVAATAIAMTIPAAIAIISSVSAMIIASAIIMVIMAGALVKGKHYVYATPVWIISIPSIGNGRRSIIDNRWRRRSIIYHRRRSIIHGLRRCSIRHRRWRITGRSLKLRLPRIGLLRIRRLGIFSSTGCAGADYNDHGQEQSKRFHG